MLTPDTTLGEIAADDALVAEFIDSVMVRGARSAMRRAIGDSSPAQYDKADRIADGIGCGIRTTLAVVVAGHE